jgi:hypothetical protein
MEKIAKKLEKKSLSGKDVLDLVCGKANLLTYSDLMKYEDIDEAMGPHKALILLFETRSGFGHWCCVFRQNKDTIEFFDPYGIKPDEELKWTKDYLVKKHGKAYPYLTWLLVNSKYKKITYNHHKFQKYQKDVNVCGRHVGLRLCGRRVPLNAYIKLFTESKFDSDLLVTMMTMFL